MKLFVFSIYAKRREAQRTAERVEALKSRLNEPGIVNELKQELDGWLALHKEVTEKTTT